MGPLLEGPKDKQNKIQIKSSVQVLAPSKFNSNFSGAFS